MKVGCSTGYNQGMHDFRYVTAEDGRMRMECNCGKRSHWAETYRPVMRAQDRHADQVARGNR